MTKLPPVAYKKKYLVVNKKRKNEVLPWYQQPIPLVY